MKGLLLSLVLLLSGCTSKKPDKVTNQFRQLASVQFELTEEEAALNDCFTSSKVSCYELYPYEEIEKRWGDSEDEYQDRMAKTRLHFDSCAMDHALNCSKLAGREDLVENINAQKASHEMTRAMLLDLDWFFLSPSRINRFLDFVKSIGKIKDKIETQSKKILKTSKKVTLAALHGTGVGVTGSLFAGVGSSLTMEALILNEHLALFCAPGVQLTTDIGVQLSFSGVKTLSCKTKEDYKGKFLSLQAGISGELIGIPAGIGAAYSFGMDTHLLLQDLLMYKKNNQLNPKDIIAELIILENALMKELVSSSFTKMQKASLWLAMKLSRKLTSAEDVEKSESALQFKKTGVKLEDITGMQGASLSYLIKFMLQSQKIQNILTSYKLRNLKIFFKSMVKSLSGCDSISGNISASLSLSPVSVGVMMTHYEELFNADLDRLLSLRNLSAFMLMNPLLMDYQSLSTVYHFAKLVEDFPFIVKNTCYGKANKRLHETIYLIDDLFK